MLQPGSRLSAGALNDRYCAATKCRFLGEKRKSLVHANYVNDPEATSAN